MRTTVVLLGLVLVTSSLPAQAAPPLTLAELYQRLDTVSPRMAAAEARAVAARARIRPAGRWPDPTIQLALMNRNLPGLGLSDPLGMNQIQVMQMVPTAGKTGLAVKAARAGAEAERERSREVALEIRAEAAMRFFELYQAEATVSVMVEGRTLLAEALRSAEAMYATGQSSQSAVLRGQVEIARMDEGLLRMRAMREAMASGINALRGLPLETPVGAAVLPRFPETPPARDSLEALALAGRPMLAAGAHDAEASDYLARRAGREIWPDLTVGLVYGQRPMDGGTDRMASFMLGFTLPLSPGSRQRQMEAEARAMHAMTVADLDAMRVDTRSRVGALIAELGRTDATTRHYRTTLLPQLDAGVATALAGYRNGLVDFMTLLESAMALITARQELARLAAETGKAYAELEMLTAVRFLETEAPATAPGGAR